MFVANVSQKNIRRLQPNALFPAILNEAHIHFPIQNYKSLGAIVDVPLVGLICPM